MGCFWSCEGSVDRCMQCGRRAVNNLIIIDHICEVCIARRQQIESSANHRRRPQFGEYRCSCGRYWSSRLCWPGSYQLCKQCKKRVYPFTTRELRASDMAGVKENAVEHQRELCQMCMQLGKYCGRFGR